MYLMYDGFFARMRNTYFGRLFETCGLSASSLLLDYGCGPGDLLLVARDKGIPAVGVDAFPRSVELAQARGLSVTLADANSLPYPTAHFDAIVLQSVIEHVRDPLSLLAALTPYLKPGGTLVVSAPTPASEFWDDPTHIRPFTPASLRTLGELCELQILTVSYVFSYLLGFTLSNSLVYKLMNLLPLPLGSNVVAFFRKPG